VHVLVGVGGGSKVFPASFATIADFDFILVLFRSKPG
jgi:hypothetical protein